jgi:hypothetical protein
MARTGRPPGSRNAPPSKKECRGCKRTFPLAPFYFARHPTCLYGYHSRCRECVLLGRGNEYGRSAEEREELRARKWRARAPLKPGQRCDECCGMSHRRPQAGCPRCSLPYEPLPPLELVTHRSYEAAVPI